VLFDSHGCGPSRRAVLDEQIKSGERGFKEVSEEMWGSLNVPFDDGFAVMRDVLEVDPDFKSFHAFCIANNIPFNVISAGLKPILRRVLDHTLGPAASSTIPIIANDAVINTPGSEWVPVWLHADSKLGHDKALSVQTARAEAAQEYADQGSVPLIVFIGDGVSDLPAAREADVLFARRGLALEDYCVENKIAYIPYDSFADIQTELEKIKKADEQVTGGKGVPVVRNPRADFWRRVSSKTAVPKAVLAQTPTAEKAMLWPERFGGVDETVAA
jgi:2-hydroxy-3-keto-5-methylthiopentenyl-1-phosphate phosphatase